MKGNSLQAGPIVSVYTQLTASYRYCGICVVLHLPPRTGIAGSAWFYTYCLVQVLWNLRGFRRFLGYPLPPWPFVSNPVPSQS